LDLPTRNEESSMATVSAEGLRRVVNRALNDEAYAQRLFEQPDAVAEEAGLSAPEALVLKHMNQERFDIARADATTRSKSGELSDQDLSGVAGGTTLSLTSTTTDMIIGRSLTSATGGSYSNLSAASCGCCGWSGSIGTGMLTLPAGG
jgi:hypothetical protein